MAAEQQIVYLSVPPRGNLDPFDNEVESFSSWFERFEIYCVLNATDEESKKNLFLTSLGGRNYNLIHKACLPEKPTDKSLEDLKKILLNKYDPPGLITTNRYLFSRRDQRDGETAAEFILTLQELASKCNYGTSINEHCADRLICGLKNENVRRKLLSEPNLTFEKAKEIVLQEEAIRQQSEALSGTASISSINYNRRPNNYHPRGDHRQNFRSNLNTRSNYSRNYNPQTHYTQNSTGIGGGQHQSHNSHGNYNKSSFSQRGSSRRGGHPGNVTQVNKCHRCGRLHNPQTCPARFWTCNNCSQQGHTAPNCNTGVRFVQEQHEDENVYEDNDEGLAEALNMATIKWISAMEECNLEQGEDLLEEESWGNLKSELTIIIRDVDSGEHKISLNESKKLISNSEESGHKCQSELKGVSNCQANKSNESIKSDKISQKETKHIFRAKNNLNIFSNKVSKPELVRLEVDGKYIQMEIDCGAAVSIIPEQQFKSLFPKRPLNVSKCSLSSVSGPIKVEGQISVTVIKDNSQKWVLPLVVCKGENFGPLLGRNWLDELSPGWRNISTSLGASSNNKIHFNRFSDLNDVTINIEVNKLIVRYPKVFRKDSDGFIEGYVANLVLKEGAVPVFHKAYPLPFALREVVKQELLRLESEGKIKRVAHSEWASPIWPVKKKDGGYRLCADVSRTVNPNLKIDVYPLPTIEEIVQEMAGKKYFVVLDLSEAYLQLKVSPESQRLLTINTCLGLFQFSVLIFGIASAPSIFQSIIDQILFGLSSVRSYIDDIIVAANSFEACLSLTNEVLNRLNRHNIRIKVAKCSWFKPSVEYLGHLLDQDGYHPTESKVKAILDAKTPTNISELRAYVGMLNFYSKFMPHMSRDLKPLYRLTEKQTPFVWTTECQSAFDLSKKKLLCHNILVPYDPTKHLIVSSDASPYGIGCVLSQVMAGNSSNKSNKNYIVEKPVMFASCSLNSSQQKYSQLEREGLGVIFALQKFYKYIWGRKFKLVIDNAPLKGILNPVKPLSILASDRLIRWSLFLRSFCFDIEHRKSELLSPADAMSRLPTNSSLVEPVLHVSLLPSLPLTISDISFESQKDPVIRKAMQYTWQGWPNYNKDVALDPFYKIRSHLAIEQNCLMYGQRVIIPNLLHRKVLELLHAGHPGIVRCKMLARENVWWPALNSDITLVCQTCEPCNIVNFKPVSSETIPWPKSQFPMQRCHIDFFEIQKLHFLILIDSFSKWPEVWFMPSCNISTTLNTLRMFFANAGLPIEMVSDNGPPFDSHEYRYFCSQNNILASYSPPYHPESNGLAERNVQTIKKGLKKLLLQQKDTKNSVHQLLASFLLSYRTTPTTATGKTPASLWLGFSPRTHLSLINPKYQLSNIQSQYLNLPFKEGDEVIIKLSPNSPVVKAIAVKPLGYNRYLVSLNGVLKSLSLNQISCSVPKLRDCKVSPPLLGDGPGSEPEIDFTKHTPITLKSSLEKIVGQRDSKDNELSSENENLNTSYNECITSQSSGSPDILSDSRFGLEPFKPEFQYTSRRSMRERKPLERLNL